MFAMFAPTVGLGRDLRASAASPRCKPTILLHGPSGQFTGAAMPPPAASPLSCLAHYTCAVAAFRRVPIALRYINIAATAPSTGSALASRLDVKQSTGAIPAPGTPPCGNGC